MKSVLFAVSASIALVSIALVSVAQASSISEIFQSIADAAPAGNGDGHHVEKLRGPFSKSKEIAKLKAEVRGISDCRYDVVTGISDGIASVDKQWNDSKTANRLEGAAKKGMIQEIVYSVWDTSTGDSEYCMRSRMKVYGADGSVLVFDFNETD